MTDWHYRPARETAQALQTGALDSEALTRTLLERIETKDEPLNAVIHRVGERALEDAKNADRERAEGRIRGPLHGLPLTIKDVWEVEGMPCTAGAPGLKNHRPERHADVVQRLVQAGAIIMGKTNVPLFASDTQTYNKLFGVTNNPYDVTRTPGGSSGGAAAALAAGFTPLEVGSDVGGSIRTPAHFTGVFGHKPSRDIISMRGHIPGPPGTMSQPDLAEGGPMARCADDLAFLLEIIAAPRPHEGAQWQISLPPAAISTLGETRVGLWLSDPDTPIEQALSKAYQGLAQTLRTQGAQVDDMESHILDHHHFLPLYYNLLGGLLGTGFKPKQRRQMKRNEYFLRWFGRWLNVSTGIKEYAAGVNQSFIRYVQTHERREKMRAAAARTLFENVDVILAPVTPTSAIKHDHSQPMFRRTVSVNGQKRPYTDQMNWIALATVLGLPATCAPIGRDGNGMPYGIQIIGAPGQDLTTIRFAQLLEEAGLSGFSVPEGF